MPQQFINAQVERVAAEVATALAQQKAQPFNASLAATRAQEFRAAEAAREAARAALIEAHRALDGAGAALETARTEGRTGDLPALEAALAAAKADVRAGQGRLAQAQADLEARKRLLVEVYGTASSIAQLGRGVPLALLPVRIETRYFALDAARYELRLRIFPDAAHLDDHQPLMSRPEYDAGRRYWQARLEEGPQGDATIAAWHALCEQVGEPRAAWIAATLDPFGRDGRHQAEPGGQPPVPELPLAPEGWADAARVRALPDRWAVVGFRGDKRVLLHWGAPVPPDLQVSFEAGAAGSELDEAADAAEPDAGVRWLTDFAAAEAAGMALRVPVEKPIARHMDRLLVFGVRASQPPAEGAQALQALLAAQAATGFGFLAYGTPTNNTERERSGYRALPHDHAPLHQEFLHNAPGSSIGGTDGERLAQALDVNPATFRRVPGSRGVPQNGAEEMHRLLWYATLDPLLRQQVEADASEAAITFARDHFIQRLRPRGPLPLVRVQAQPYGVLPVVSLHRWRPLAASTRETVLVNILRSILNALFRFDPGIRQLSTSDDPQRDLLQILTGSPHSFTQQAVTKSFPTDLDAASAAARMRPWWDAVLPALASGPIDVFVPQGGIRLNVRPFGFGRATTQYATARPLVSDAEDKSAPIPAGVNYLAHLASRPALAAVRSNQIAGAAGRPLLYLLLRQAYEAVPTFTLELHTLFFQALGRLKDLPIATLEALAADVIDACSYRLDAWITSIASSRLRELRTVRNVKGVHIGGYAWLEGLVPPGEGAVQGAPVREDPDSAGYLHLPSPAQARTAAVLHGAFLAHAEQRSGATLDINLSSERVRTARWLLSGMRQGQPLGALLGYRLERRVIADGLGEHIPVLRRIAPLAVGPTDPADPERDRTREDPATTEVSDGLVLTFLHSQGTLDDRLRAHGLPRAAELRIVQAVGEVADALDALSDLLLAEGVHQATAGNAARAGAAFDAMAEGDGAVPEPEVSATPVSGQQVGQRLFVPLPAAGGDGWPGDAHRPRALAEPRLNAWAAALLGEPADIGFSVSFAAPDGSAAEVRTYTLAAFDLCPLDLVYLAGPVAQTAPLTDLLTYLLRARGPDGSGFAGDLALDLTRQDGGRSLEEALGLAHALQRVLAEGRALRPADLTLGQAGDDGDEAELTGRADATAAVLRTLRAQFDAEPARHDLWWRAAVLMGAVDPGEASALAGLQAELARRLDDHDGAGPAPLARLAALLGKSFRVLPVLHIANGGELTAAFADQSTLLAGDGTRPRRWLHDHGRVRPGAEALDMLLTLADLLGAPHALNVGQLPLRPGEVWAGERVAEKGAAPRLSLVAHTPLVMDYRQPLAGLLVDGWSDVVPRRTLTTGLAFHYDAPKVQPPQAILIALPPDANRSWEYEDLEATLLEAFELARVRLTNAGGMGFFADYLPALYLQGDLQPDLKT